MARKKALVVVPGRGTYNAAELGYLARQHADRRDMVAAFDAIRAQAGQPTLTELDGAARFQASLMLRGDNASGLIFACSYLDFLAIDRDRFDIVAVTGNSMGWYTALACAGATSGQDGFLLANTMGTLMHAASIGGQLLHIFVDDDWRPVPGLREHILGLVRDIPALHLSIDLGGMIALAGTPQALAAAEKRLDKVQDRFPMRLAGHAAFHSPMQEPVSDRAMTTLPANLFRQPDLPLIDGRGSQWWPKSTGLAALREYTLGNQVVEPYDFTAAIRTGLRELAPDAVIVLGPGSTLFGATAQAIILSGWNDISGKADFMARQKEQPFLIGMGSPEQRDLAA